MSGLKPDTQVEIKRLDAEVEKARIAAEVSFYLHGHNIIADGWAGASVWISVNALSEQ